MRRVLIAVTATLALVPGLASGLATREATGWGFALALASDIVLALLAVRALEGTEAPRGARALVDLGAWFAATGALVGTTLLSTPLPRWLGGDGPARHRALLAGAVVAAASVLVALSRRRETAWPAGSERV